MRKYGTGVCGSSECVAVQPRARLVRAVKTMLSISCRREMLRHSVASRSDAGRVISRPQLRGMSGYIGTARPRRHKRAAM